jgi:glycosyltransferase involved in cell wall biosynthesis
MEPARKEDGRRPPDLSVIVPVRDEAENVAPLALEVAAALQGSGWSWECCWVDDGSTDGTLTELRRIHARDDRHRFVSLDRPYGQSAALAVGFRWAAGPVLATLDGDGQNDPAGIPVLARRLAEGDLHMVNGWRRRRRDTWVRRWSSVISNAFRNRLTGESVRDVGCALRVFRRECVLDVPVFAGMHRFLPTLVRMAGWDRIEEMPVEHRPRTRGRTKYGIGNRLWVGILDTLAVRWMQARMVRPRIALSSDPKEGGDRS